MLRKRFPKDGAVIQESSTLYDLVISGGTVHAGSVPQLADVGIAGEKIGAIAVAGSLAGKERVDAKGMHVLPGLWHCHCHFREPGLTRKEDFESGTAAAALGGITFVNDQTNNEPHPTTLENFELKRQLVEKKAHVDFGLFGGGLHPEEIEGIAKAGAIAIKIFNTRHVKEVYPYISDLGVVDHGLMYEIYEAAGPLGIPVAVHHDDTDWVKRLVTRDYLDKGRTSNKWYMDAYQKGYMYGHGMVAGLAASIYYARLTNVKLYVLHVGMMPVGAFDFIRVAKEDFGQTIYAELEGSAMLMTRERAEKMGPRQMIWAHSPEASWQSLRNGLADVLVIEHAPHLLDELEPGWKDNFGVPLGQTGVQEFVPLMLTQINEGRLTLAVLVRLASENPAKIFGVYPRKGCIAVGSDADFTIVDLNAKQVLRDVDMRSKTGFTVWDGFEVTGMPRYTIVRGAVVMAHGKLSGKPGYGRFTKGVAAR